MKLTSFASLEEESLGRLHKEKDCEYRSVYGRDRDRIMNCNAFRRLQYKTQVFVNHEGDHYRTRLTHSLEVAQISRWIASGLGVSKDLAEVVSLSHDLGHAPFGHAGEDALNEKMQNFGGFDHNAHSLEIITKLEKYYTDFDGLNMSWEMLEGVVKHNGPLKNKKAIPGYILAYNDIHDLKLDTFPSIEAQISAISDDIAYNNHDIEDGIRADLFEVEQLFDLPFIGEKFKDILAKHPKINKELLISEVKRGVINDMVLDVIYNTLDNIKKFSIKTTSDVRGLGQSLVCFSEKVEIAHQELKKFLMKNMYNHYKVNRMRANATRIVGGLFDFFIENPDCLPLEWKKRYEKTEGERELVNLVSEYIAGMTDRFAIKEYKELLK